MIEELFDGCAVPLLFFQSKVQAQHASAAALAEQQKQEMERQREQLSEACAVGAVSSLSRKRVKVSSTYIIPVQTDTFLLTFFPKAGHC